jgi:hypothetical protein
MYGVVRVFCILLCALTPYLSAHPHSHSRSNTTQTVEVYVPVLRPGQGRDTRNDEKRALFVCLFSFLHRFSSLPFDLLLLFCCVCDLDVG